MWTVIGIVGAFATIIVVIVYIISHIKRNPKVILRMANEIDYSAFIYENPGQFLFALSTQRTANVLLKSICVESPNSYEIVFSTNDLFVPKISPEKRHPIMCWQGQEQIQRGYFLAFILPFSISSPIDNTPYHTKITVTAQIDPAHWSFPWAMFSSLPKNTTFKQDLIWFQDAPNGMTNMLKMSPGESCSVHGSLAQNAFRAVNEQSADLDIQVSEIFKDNTYRTNRITNKPSTKN